MHALEKTNKYSHAQCTLYAPGTKTTDGLAYPVREKDS